MGMLMYDLHVHLLKLVADRYRATGHTYHMWMADGLMDMQMGRAEEQSHG